MAKRAFGHHYFAHVVIAQQDRPTNKEKKKPAFGRPHNLSKCAKKSNEKTRKIKENLVKTMKTKKTRKIKKSQKKPSKTKEKHTNNTT